MRFTTTAQDHLAREQQWWLENRDYRDLFATELEEAVALVARLPGAGTHYTGAGLSGIRRLYLQKIGCHLYYTYDDHDVIVRALWGAHRERGPTL